MKALLSRAESRGVELVNVGANSAAPLLRKEGSCRVPTVFGPHLRLASLRQVQVLGDGGVVFDRSEVVG